jgi:hypothetical protein
MSLRFQHRVSIFPGVRLNFSPSGVSATVGVRGASVTIGGPGGPTANLGIPGTGISYRARLGSHSPQNREAPTPLADPPQPPSTVTPPTIAPAAMKAIQSGDVQTLTTPGLGSLKDLLLRSQTERAEADKNLEKANEYLLASKSARDEAQSKCDRAEQTVARLKASWFRRFRSGRIAQKEMEAEQARRRIVDVDSYLAHAHELKELAEQRCAELYVDLDFGLSGAAHAAWTRLTKAFETLSKSEKVWDITASRAKRRGEERSVATEIVDRTPTTISFSNLPIVQSEYHALHWRNVNGSDLYLYPGFLIVYQTNHQFAVLELSEITLRFATVGFQELEQCPTDAERAGFTWTYTNKDGSPDRRYSVNPQIPVMAYGQLYWTSNTGLSEAFMFSRGKAAAIFADVFQEFCTTILQVN